MPALLYAYTLELESETKMVPEESTTGPLNPVTEPKLASEVDVPLPVATVYMLPPLVSANILPEYSAWPTIEVESVAVGLHSAEPVAPMPNTLPFDPPKYTFPEESITGMEVADSPPVMWYDHTDAPVTLEIASRYEDDSAKTLPDVYSARPMTAPCTDDEKPVKAVPVFVYARTVESEQPTNTLPP